MVSRYSKQISRSRDPYTLRGYHVGCLYRQGDPSMILVDPGSGITLTSSILMVILLIPLVILLIPLSMNCISFAPGHIYRVLIPLILLDYISYYNNIRERGSWGYICVIALIGKSGGSVGSLGSTSRSYTIRRHARPRVSCRTLFSNSIAG